MEINFALHEKKKNKKRKKKINIKTQTSSIHPFYFILEFNRMSKDFKSWWMLNSILKTSFLFIAKESNPLVMEFLLNCSLLNIKYSFWLILWHFVDIVTKCLLILELTSLFRKVLRLFVEFYCKFVFFLWIGSYGSKNYFCFDELDLSSKLSTSKLIK